MPPKYTKRKTLAKSDDEGFNSPEQDGEDIVKIFAAVHSRMEKKAKYKQKKLSLECDTTIKCISDLAHELAIRHKQDLYVPTKKESKIKQYSAKQEELEEERLSIVKKLRSEEAQYLQIHDSIVNELIKFEVSQLKANQAFERKYGSFIEGELYTIRVSSARFFLTILIPILDTHNQFKSPIVRKTPFENPFIDSTTASNTKNMKQ
ncbi:hypothetical protein G9A89_002441 [Geosiphon pyriformis]|nr:hypothetical protein G9A89_002441 [Geosiphon pyriformis]